MPRYYAGRAEVRLGMWISSGGGKVQLLEEVIADCTACIQGEPGRVQAYMTRARAHRLKRAYDEAERDYRKGAQLQPSLRALVERELQEMTDEQTRGNP